MIDDHKSLRQSLINFFGILGLQFRAALSTGIAEDDCPRKEDGPIDPDFEGWLHGNPLVTKNPLSRYGDRTPGYITGNGLCSMEIGAADE